MKGEMSKPRSNLTDSKKSAPPRFQPKPQPLRQPQTLDFGNKVEALWKNFEGLVESALEFLNLPATISSDFLDRALDHFDVLLRQYNCVKAIPALESQIAEFYKVGFVRLCAAFRALVVKGPIPDTLGDNPYSANHGSVSIMNSAGSLLLFIHRQAFLEAFTGRETRLFQYLNCIYHCDDKSAAWLFELFPQQGALYKGMLENAIAVEDAKLEAGRKRERRIEESTSSKKKYKEYEGSSDSSVELGYSPPPKESSSSDQESGEDGLYCLPIEIEEAHKAAKKEREKELLKKKKREEEEAAKVKKAAKEEAAKEEEAAEKDEAAS